MAGEHKSPYHGFAIEFAQHREYAPGDDLRYLDWKVLGRTDRYYIKQFEQETNYVAHVLLDGSESMKYGSGKWTKLAYGKMLAACLSYLILHQRDAVALDIELPPTVTLDSVMMFTDGEPLSLTAKSSASKCTYLWSTDGSGDFTAANSATTLYKPSRKDEQNGVRLDLKVTSVTGVCGVRKQVVVLK